MSAHETRALHAWMVAHEQEMIDFLRRIVDMDTATANQDGVEALALLMADTMEKCGFDVERRPATTSAARLGDPRLHGRAVRPAALRPACCAGSRAAPVTADC